MTNSNGSFNPNPFANPFNTRLGQSNYSLNPAGNSYKQNIYRSDSNALLPDPIMLGQLANADLHVPDTTPPINFRQFLADVDQYARNKTWNDSNTYYDIFNNNLNCNHGLSKKDIDYWNKANLESAKLSSNMSDEQKQMMAEISNMFPPSKLELED